MKYIFLEDQTLKQFFQIFGPLTYKLKNGEKYKKHKVFGLNLEKVILWLVTVNQDLFLCLVE